MSLRSGAERTVIGAVLLATLEGRAADRDRLAESLGSGFPEGESVVVRNICVMLARKYFSKHASEGEIHDFVADIDARLSVRTGFRPALTEAVIHDALGRKIDGLECMSPGHQWVARGLVAAVIAQHMKLSKRRVRSLVADAVADAEAAGFHLRRFGD